MDNLDNHMDLVYTVNEVSKLLKVNKNTIYDLIDSGIIKTIKLGATKITRKSLLSFLELYDGYDLSDLTDIKLLHDYNVGKTCGKEF